jgi:hypothetical protein
VVHEEIGEEEMKKTYTRARMVEHNTGANAGKLEFRFYDKNDKLLRQRWVDAGDFRHDCEKRVVKLQLDTEHEIFDGTHPLCIGPKIIMADEPKLKVH